MPIDIKKKKINIIGATDREFQGAWNSFLKSYQQYSYYYQLPIIDYFKMLSNDVIDLSFVLKISDTSLAICPLIIEKYEGHYQASMSKGYFLPISLFHTELSVKQIRSLEKKVFDEIKTRLDKYKVSRLFVQADVLSVGFDNIEDQMFAKFGALDVSIHHHIIDLRLSDEVLWPRIRHSYQHLINRGLKTYKFKVYDKSNFTPPIGERHRLLHHKTAGRITRPIATFEKMYSWIEHDCGLMFEQLIDNQVAQMLFVALGKGTAVAASAADDPDIDIPVPLMHSMIYFISQEAKRRGINYYDVQGTTYRNTLHAMYTPKQMSIHLFKRGFSNRGYPLKQWVWFVSPEEEIKYLEEQLTKYKQFLLK